jgi:predicted DNA-binding transcriptional regulator YafY
MASPGTGAAEQLARVLTLIPWLRARPGVSKTEAADAFGISVEQLEADLGLAVCAEVGRDSLASIDIDYWDDTITVLDAQTVDRPLRLRLDEAVSLLVALQELAGAQGFDLEPVNSSLAKLEDALGSIPGAEVLNTETPGRPDRDFGVRPEVVTAIRRALDEHRRLHLAYWVPARDELTQRDVDPVRLQLGDPTYLQGWCHLTDSMRTFRLDRVLEATVLDVPADPPSQAQPTELPRPGVPWRAGPDDHVVVLDLAADARWVVDYHPVESASEQPGGALRVVLRTPDLGWARRLVLRLGGRASVVEPVELRTEVSAAATRALAAYSPESPPNG